MFNPNRKEYFKGISEINVTPLVDVCLVLVIIFMVTVPMLFQPLADIIMPKAYTGTEQNKQVIYITVTKEKRLMLDSDDVNFRTLTERLRVKLIKSRDKVVIIRADERLAYNRITRLMAIAKKAGAEKLYFATEYKKRNLKK